MKIDQNSSAVVVFLCSCYEPGSSILHSLESGDKMVGNAVQQADSNVKTRRNVGMNHTFGSFPVKQILNSWDPTAP